MIKQEPWFIQERAVAFASLLLTKRKDGIVRAQTGTDTGIALLVEVVKDGKSALRFFGVQLVGSLDLPDVQGADGRALTHLPGEPSDATLPVCVFVIGVRKPEGLYRWVVEPVVADGRALLRRDGQPGWHVLDEAGVGRLIGRVEAWYDALQGDLMPKPRDGRAQADS
jgi:hypothetical protein